MKEKPITPKQEEFLAALRAGHECHYMRYMGRFNPAPYYFCGPLRCTKQVEALLKRGVVEVYDKSQFGEHKIRIKQSA